MDIVFWLRKEFQRAPRANRGSGSQAVRQQHGRVRRVAAPWLGRAGLAHIQAHANLELRPALEANQHHPFTGDGPQLHAPCHIKVWHAQQAELSSGGRCHTDLGAQAQGAPVLPSRAQTQGTLHACPAAGESYGRACPGQLPHLSW